MSEKLSSVLDADLDRTKPRPDHEGRRRIPDYYRWAFEQAEFIRAGRFDKVDTINVAEEIEDVGKSEVRELRSNLENILVHILKWERQPQRRTRSWALSIAEHRRRVERTLKDNPSLTAKLAEVTAEAYDVARLRAARETALSLRRFPESCPFDRDTVMTLPYEIDRD